jgi:hypothetical protein
MNDYYVMGDGRKIRGPYTRQMAVEVAVKNREHGVKGTILRRQHDLTEQVREKYKERNQSTQE